MAKVHITDLVVLDNPANFFNPFQFKIIFECIERLHGDLEWQLIYVGSAESETYDQILDTVYVGPVQEGRHSFVFQADPPDVTRIPEQDAVGVTIVLLTCSYRGQEFVRVGYFINNEYTDPELREVPPPKPIFEKLTRNILAKRPRVTRFKIHWDDSTTATNGDLNMYEASYFDDLTKVKIKNVVFHGNPKGFLDPFRFELTFECIEELKGDLEWRFIYFGSADFEGISEDLQIKEVNSVLKGKHSLVLQAHPPDVTLIPDPVGMNGLRISGRYNGQEFVREDYFIKTEYTDPDLQKKPPKNTIFEKLTCHILTKESTVRRFKINWDNDGIAMDACLDDRFSSLAME